MKKILLAVTGMTLIVGLSFAQSKVTNQVSKVGDQAQAKPLKMENTRGQNVESTISRPSVNRDPAKLAERKVEILNKQMQLNEQQREKAKAIYTKNADAAQDAKTDRRAVMEKESAEIKALLNKEQLTKYEEMEKGRLVRREMAKERVMTPKANDLKAAPATMKSSSNLK